MNWLQRIANAKKNGNKFTEDDKVASNNPYTCRVGECQKGQIDPSTGDITRGTDRLKILDGLSMAFSMAVALNRIEQVERLYILINEWPMLSFNLYQAAIAADQHWLGRYIGKAKIITKQDAK